MRQYIRVDRVNYSDGSHPENCPGGIDLWPIESDGQGASLTRKIVVDYGNDPDNWIAAPPSTRSINRHDFQAIIVRAFMTSKFYSPGAGTEAAQFVGIVAVVGGVLSA